MEALNDTAIAALALRPRELRSVHVWTMRDIIALTGAHSLDVLNLERDGVLPCVRRDRTGRRVWSAAGFAAAVRIVQRHLDGGE